MESLATLDSHPTMESLATMQSNVTMESLDTCESTLSCKDQDSKASKVYINFDRGGNYVFVDLQSFLALKSPGTRFEVEHMS